MLRKTLAVSPYLLIQPLYRNIIEFRQVTVEHHLHTPNRVYLVFYQDVWFIHYDQVLGSALVRLVSLIK